MRTSRIEFRTRVELTGKGDIEITEQSWLGDDMTGAKRIFVKPDELAPAMRKLGWMPPLTENARTISPNDVGPLLAQIAGDGAQSPMLAFIEPDRVLVGGTVNETQLRSLSELLAKVEK